MMEGPWVSVSEPIKAWWILSSIDVQISPILCFSLSEPVFKSVCGKLITSLYTVMCAITSLM